MIIVVFRLLSVSAIAIYPFIVVKEHALKKEPILINHEKIHHRQQLELLIIPFYVAYLINYLINLIRYRNHYLAYREIIFEREAFVNDSNLNYLKHRKLWAFCNFAASKNENG